MAGTEKPNANKRVILIESGVDIIPAVISSFLTLLSDKLKIFAVFFNAFTFLIGSYYDVIHDITPYMMLASVSAARSSSPGITWL